MRTLGRADILGTSDLPRERVDCPEWGGCVWIRTMTSAERDSWEAARLERKGRRMAPSLDNLRASLVVYCCVDEEGKRIFADDDAEALGGKSAKVLDRLFAVAQRINGVGDEDLESLVKNSVNGQCVDSASG